MDSINIRGTFSSSLRNRSIWKVIGPILTMSPEQFQESGSQIPDFIFQQQGCSPLHALLLTTTSIELQKQDIISQVEQFASNQLPCAKKVIAFLLSENAFSSASGKYGLDGLLAVQVLILENLSSSMPVIPIPNASSLVSCIQKYMANLEDIPATLPSLGDSIALLAHVTSHSHPLSGQNVNILSDLYPSFRALSRAVRTEEGRKTLVDYLGEEEATKIIKFWQEDMSLE
ncbi:hypothetical protein P175DRAFT_0527419 [Aspergillus ochraceoroseus IBT 24754]|uniref:Uncharacterized protein n=1 Tax=Aspergillus ochraceoroseus IBT 24754 TaxID=1392256 RepID=A0A2T5M5Z9_9EURO|nr:uncharacterized protein P175DRAFT_0527419 [Aspergillus ochraceoroseus IBT 24754]PTU23965.1 hypothetical protein P175DRAFT_0527419 [Aspergillus ochraceoroseus IBT 24754]